MVGAGNHDDGAARRGRRHAERIAVALDDEHRDLRRVEFGEPVVLGLAGRVHGERERDDSRRAGTRRRCGRQPARRSTGRR